MSDRRPFLPEDLVRTRRLSGLDCSPNGRWAVAALDELSADGKSWDTNLYRLDLAEPAAEPVALTADTRQKGAPRFRPDGMLGFLCEPDAAERRDEPADEKKEETPKRQLHLLDPAGGAARRLTDLPGGVQDYRWSADGRRLVLLSPVHPESRDLEHERQVRKERAERKESGVVHDGWPLRFWDHFLGPDFTHLIVAGADGEAPRDLTPGLAFGLHEPALAISPDGSTVAVDWHEIGEGRRIEAWVALVDAESGERRDLRPEGSADAFGARFSPDGSRLAWLVHPRAPGATGKQDLVVHELESGEQRTITASMDLWPAELEWIDDETLAWSGDQDGHHRLFVQRADEDGARAVTSEGVIQNWCLLPGGEAALAGINRFHVPAEVNRIALGDNAEPRALTDFNAGFRDGPFKPGS
jgi:dipeptidyl aminopeptidase/acylaminoacyl peptidase